ncbi:hypothetical protein ES703_70611 [subsurface metagenome]
MLPKIRMGINNAGRARQPVSTTSLPTCLTLPQGRGFFTVGSLPTIIQLKIMNDNMRRMPGSMPAKKQALIDVKVIQPYIIMKILGGIISASPAEPVIKATA